MKALAVQIRGVSVGWVLICAATALILAFILAPVAVVIVAAFDDRELMAFPPHALSLRWFAAFFRHTEFITSLELSARLGLIAALASTLLGTTAALALHRRRREAPFMQTFLLSPLYVPRVLIGLALLLAFARLNLAGGFLGLLLGHVLITMPYALRTVAVALHGVEPSVEEAARMLGARGWQVFRLVTFPLIRSAVLSGFVFAFIVSFSDIYLALFIAGPQTVTLPLRLFNVMEWDQSPLIAAASTVQIGLILTAVVITGRLFGLSSPGRMQ